MRLLCGFLLAVVILSVLMFLIGRQVRCARLGGEAVPYLGCVRIDDADGTVRRVR